MEQIIGVALLGISGLTVLIAVAVWIRKIIVRSKRRKKRRRMG